MYLEYNSELTRVEGATIYTSIKENRPGVFLHDTSFSFSRGQYDSKVCFMLSLLDKLETLVPNSPTGWTNKLVLFDILLCGPLGSQEWLSIHSLPRFYVTF